MNELHMVIDECTIYILGQERKVTITRSTRAKRMRLQFTPFSEIILILPPLVPIKSSQVFLQSCRGWLEKKFLKLPQKSVSLRYGYLFKDRDIIAVFGATYQIVYDPYAAKGVTKVDGLLLINSSPENIHWFIVKWLYNQSYIYFNQLSADYAARLNIPFNRVRIKELKSRWGSCSAGGDISYSWRLSLAPRPIAEYLCAHEVSHLKEMNHSKAFWQVVATLCPDYKNAQQWLKHEGTRDLLKYAPL